MDKSVADLIVRSPADISVHTENIGKVYNLENRANMYNRAYMKERFSD